MIRSEKEYQEAIERLKKEEERLELHRERLRNSGLDESQIKRAMDPMESFHLQLKEEVESYERLKKGVFDDILNLSNIGQLLVSLRIAVGLSQRDLAGLLDVHESQVSRDERNEYHGITVERANRIIEAIGVPLHTRVDTNSLKQALNG